MAISVAKQLIHPILFSSTLVILAGACQYVKLYGNDVDGRTLYESDGDDSCDEGCQFIIGLILLALAPFVIFWNEMSYEQLRLLHDAARSVVHDLPTSKTAPGFEKDGQFVCFNGRLEGGVTLSDIHFPCVSVPDTLLLCREIEILQYVQRKKSDDNYVLEEKWCKSPQIDPSRFKDKKNRNGNWEAFANTDRSVGTGHKLKGESIRFGDRKVILRAPNPCIGVFHIPQSFMNKAFLGDRHISELRQYLVMKSLQGKWSEVDISGFSFGTVKICGSEIKVFKNGQFVYDGEEMVGTIRMHWECANPQNMTVAGEAVAPGRAVITDYGLTEIITDEPGAVAKMAFDELCPAEERRHPHKDMFQDVFVPQDNEILPNLWARAEPTQQESTVKKCQKWQAENYDKERPLAKSMLASEWNGVPPSKERKPCQDLFTLCHSDVLNSDYGTRVEPLQENVLLVSRNNEFLLEAKVELLQNESAAKEYSLIPENDEETGLLAEHKITPRWTIAPFPVYDFWRINPMRRSFLSHLWLHAPGLISSRQLFMWVNRENRKILWFYRAAAYAMLLIGWCLVFHPASLFLSVQIPFIYQILAMGFFIVSIFLATACWACTTAAANIVTHPFQSILVITTVCIVLFHS